MMRFLFTFLGLLLCVATFSQGSFEGQKFEQLGTTLATPNKYRTGSGAPGEDYWQQKADYEIDVTLDDENQRIEGVEKITYFNNSPHELKYLWVQLDQNVRAKDSDTYKTETSKLKNSISFREYDKMTGYADFDGGHKIKYVKNKSTGANLPYTINKTMMRIDLETPLKSNAKYQLEIKWSYNINDRLRMRGRGGYEYFEEEDNYLYTITQWFPRMAVYDDINGWQHKQFLGNGEFALTFGNYKVNITVPADHIVASTGKLTNGKEVLSKAQLNRLEQAKIADKPVFIVNEDEAKKNEKSKSKSTKTWKFYAENVRDFAFGSSRKYIWDAMGVKIGGKTVMAMSYYLKESNPLYSQYSTKVVAHTLKVYSKHTFDYPYHKAISVEAYNGMEYPMICFNYGRPNKDGSYSSRTKYGMISVIIHEIGHNFFPMIVNSDERQWTWMDEGLNSFVEFLAEQEWDVNYPSRRGPAHKIALYMKGSKDGQKPIMTNSEQIIQFGNNAYGKPATALNILRETVMGRELFDYAFKEYANRWKFKHPSPEDFFRTMEDASGMDLDWFWRGWFYTTDHVDLAISGVKYYLLSTKNPEVENPRKKKEHDESLKHVSQELNTQEKLKTAIERDPTLIDFYNNYDQFEVLESDITSYNNYLDKLNDEEKAILNKGLHFYEVSFENIGGLVMPLIIKWVFADGSEEIERIPAEIWRKNEKTATKVFAKTKPVSSIVLDPKRETADTNEDNNYYPPRLVPTRFELYKTERKEHSNPMSRSKQKEKD